MKIHFIANSYIGNSAAGGDFHLIKMARAVVKAGYDLNFFGSHALQSFVQKNDIPATYALTDETGSSNFGKFNTFHAWYKRYRRTMASLDSIGPHDGADLVRDLNYMVLRYVVVHPCAVSNRFLPNLHKFNA
jgi:hypothetical protein